MLNFELETIVDGDKLQPRLSYGYAKYMNQWTLEGFQTDKEVNADSQQSYLARKQLDPLATRSTPFTFLEGDIAIIHLDQKASDSFRGVGTH